MVGFVRNNYHGPFSIWGVFRVCQSYRDTSPGLPSLVVPVCLRTLRDQKLSLICWVTESRIGAGGAGGGWVSFKPQIAHWMRLCVLSQWDRVSPGLWRRGQGLLFFVIFTSLSCATPQSAVCASALCVGGAGGWVGELSAGLYIKSCFIFTGLLNLLSYFQKFWGAF